MTTMKLYNSGFFSARQHNMLRALYAIARPSVCPSHGWIIQKRLKLGLWNFYHTIAPSLVFAWWVSSRNCSGFPPSGSLKEGWGGGNKPFSSFKRQYLENKTVGNTIND